MGHWEAVGSVCGSCGHRHRTEDAARKCVEEHDRAIKRANGYRPGSLTVPYSDRVATFVED